MNWFLLIAAIKLSIWLALWGSGYLALVVMIGMDLTGPQIGGALILAVLCPV